MFSCFARRLVSAIVPACYGVAVISTEYDNKTLSNKEVNDVINRVRDTYNTPKVARKATEMVEQRYNEDFVLQLFLTSFLADYGHKNEQLKLLDIGCGSATTIAKMMEFVAYKSEYKTAFDSCQITGIDISSNMLKLADKNLSMTIDWISNNCKDNIPVSYDLIEADMRFLTDIFNHTDDNDKFDGILCFYSIFHVPRQEHSNIIQQMNTLLKDGGILCICLGVKDIPLYYGPLLFEDMEMYWSQYDAKENLKLFQQPNFEIIDHTVVADQLSKDVEYLFVVAKKKTNTDT